ncbi:hypothetical protein CR513_40427, partial [Mucuna pruriens]
FGQYENNGVTNYHSWSLAMQEGILSKNKLTFIKLKDNGHIIFFFEGLNDSYNLVKSQILLMEPLSSINKVFYLIIKQVNLLTLTLQSNIVAQGKGQGRGNDITYLRMIEHVEVIHGLYFLRQHIVAINYFDISLYIYCIKYNNSLVCDFCHFFKQHKLPFPFNNIKIIMPFYLVHIDIWDPLRVPCINGHHYFFTIVAYGQIYHFFFFFYQSHGIIHHISYVETLKQNSIFECKHQHILNVTK